MLRDILPLIGVLVGGFVTGGFQLMGQNRSAREAGRDRELDALATQARRITQNAQLLITVISVRRGLLVPPPTADADKSKVWQEEYDFVTTFWGQVRALNLLADQPLIDAANSLGTAVDAMLDQNLDLSEFQAAAAQVTKAIEEFEQVWLEHRGSRPALVSSAPS